MNINEIIQVISTVGFPIACAVFFLRRLSIQDDRHAKQFDQMTAAIDNNTKVVNELVHLIKEERDGNAKI